MRNIPTLLLAIIFILFSLTSCESGNSKMKNTVEYVSQYFDLGLYELRIDPTKRSNVVDFAESIQEKSLNNSSLNEYQLSKRVQIRDEKLFIDNEKIDWKVISEEHDSTNEGSSFFITYEISIGNNNKITKTIEISFGN